jgi:hypothetical protein
MHVFRSPEGEMLRVCCACGRTLPLSEFGLHSKRTGRLRSRCRDCYNDYMREFRRQRRIGCLNNYLRALGSEQTAAELRHIVSQMLKTMGGRDGFATAFHRLYQEAGKTRDGFRLRIRIFEALFRLLQATELAEQVAKERSSRDYWSNYELDLDRNAISDRTKHRWAKKASRKARTESIIKACQDMDSRRRK